MNESKKVEFLSISFQILNINYDVMPFAYFFASKKTYKAVLYCEELYFPFCSVLIFNDLNWCSVMVFTERCYVFNIARRDFQCSSMQRQRQFKMVGMCLVLVRDITIILDKERLPQFFCVGPSFGQIIRHSLLANTIFSFSDDVLS